MIRIITFQRRIPLCLCLILLTSALIDNQAQSVKRQCISSYGAIVIKENTAFMQTAGQSYNTTGYTENAAAILQGFQQPYIFNSGDINFKLPEGINLTIFPNPADYTVTIQSDNPVEFPIIGVTDFNGRLIYSCIIENLHSYSINCGSWENGIYLISVRDKNQNISSLKLMINK